MNTKLGTGKKRIFLRVITSIMLCLAVLSGRAFYEGYAALQKGEVALQKNDVKTAIRSWRRAARWYVPLAPHVRTAYNQLRNLAHASEKHGQTQTAIAAWTGIRSSVRATRSFYTPYAKRMLEADLHIASLMASLEQPKHPDIDLQTLRNWHFAMLKRDTMPSVFWSIFALGGLALWVGGGFLFALRGLNEHDKLVPKAAAYSWVCIMGGLLLWLIGLHLA